jgi:hypothetical protein
MNIFLTDTWDTVPQTIHTNLSKSEIILLENDNKIEVFDITNNIPLFETCKSINHIRVDDNKIHIYKKKIKCMYSKKYIKFDMIVNVEIQNVYSDNTISKKNVIMLDKTIYNFQLYFVINKLELIPNKISKYALKKLYDDNMIELGICMDNNIIILSMNIPFIKNKFYNIHYIERLKNKLFNYYF